MSAVSLETGSGRAGLFIHRAGLGRARIFLQQNGPGLAELFSGRAGINIFGPCRAPALKANCTDRSRELLSGDLRY